MPNEWQSIRFPSLIHSNCLHGYVKYEYIDWWTFQNLNSIKWPIHVCSVTIHTTEANEAQGANRLSIIWNFSYYQVPLWFKICEEIHMTIEKILKCYHFNMFDMYLENILRLLEIIFPFFGNQHPSLRNQFSMFPDFRNQYPNFWKSRHHFFLRNFRWVIDNSTINTTLLILVRMSTDHFLVPIP